MVPLYSHLLDPDLYNCGKAARFVDAMADPSIASATDQMAEHFCRLMSATDDILAQIETIDKSARKRIKEVGHLQCFFTAYLSPTDTITMISPTPTNPTDIQELLSAGKCLAFANKAQSIFFTSEVYHKKGEPIIGETIPTDAQWGIQVIGSSARGNSFHSLTTITHKSDNNLKFSSPKIRLDRDRRFKYPFARFFDIKDDRDFAAIISQLPKISINHPNLSEQKAITNFMSTMKSLMTLGYHK